MTALCERTKEQLYRMCDPGYRTFQSALLPTVSRDRVIGVRVPQLRRLARQMVRSGDGMRYLSDSVLPHETYDEDNLHAFLIEGIAGFDACMAELERFLPYVDNWATCDMMAPTALRTEPEKLLAAVRRWLVSDHEFTVRYGLVTLMRLLPDSRRPEELLALAATAAHDGYYVKMAAAWLLSETLAQRWACAYPYLTSDIFPLWTRKKAIQKALESRKLTDAQKARLRGLREEMRTE